MSVSNQVVAAVYTGIGQSVFVIPFAFLPNDGPAVVKAAYIDKLTGARTTLNLSTDYSLPAAVGLDPVNVVLAVPLPTGKNLLVERRTVITQIAEYQDTGIFPAKTHEKALDRLTLIVQEISARVRRALVLNPLDTVNGEVLIGKPSSVLAYTKDGLSLAWRDPGELFAEAAAGSASGKLKAPTDGTYGGSIGNPAAVAVDDTYEDAFDKVATLLSKMAPTPPANLAGRVLTIPGSYMARNATTNTLELSSASGNPVITPGLASTLANAFSDPDAGILTGEIDAAVVGTITLTTGNDSGVTDNLLQVVNEFDPYAGAGFGKEGITKGITARIQAFALAVGLHTAQLKHSLTGASALLAFAVDDPVTPTAAGGAFGINANPNLRYLSGVPSLAFNEPIAAQFTITNAIRSHYNPTRVANVFTNEAGSVDVSPSGAPGANTPFASSGPLQVLNNKYTEALTATITGYNSKGDASAAVDSVSNIRIDTVGSEDARQRSGTGQYPSSGYGSIFSNVSTLDTTKELQYLNGRFRYPPAVNYSTKRPAGPDYSALTPDTYNNMRWVLFPLTVVNTATSVQFTLNNAQNFGSAALQSGFACFVRVDGATPTTGWLDANAAYPGVGNPTANGDAALDVAGSTGTVKRVTFGAAPKTGTVYVRIGIPQGSNLAFGGIS